MQENVYKIRLRVTMWIKSAWKSTVLQQWLMSSFLVPTASRGTRECCGGFGGSWTVLSQPGCRWKKWEANVVSKDSREKKRGSSGWADERWGMEQWCWRGGGGRKEEKLKQMRSCGLQGSHLCVWGGVPPRSRRPLSCVWSRSLAGGRVEGGWQTEEEGGERWEGGILKCLQWQRSTSVFVFFCSKIWCNNWVNAAVRDAPARQWGLSGTWKNYRHAFASFCHAVTFFLKEKFIHNCILPTDEVSPMFVTENVIK